MEINICILSTRTFWTGIAFLAVVYIFVSKKAKNVEKKREVTYKKKMQDKTL
jgi:glucosamine 6-phosphate synthetase-like amidotransferase/phosphosugar isomerase protein